MGTKPLRTRTRASRAAKRTLQNDMLKEYIAQKEWIVPPRPAVRIVVDMIEFQSALETIRDLYDSLDEVLGADGYAGTEVDDCECDAFTENGGRCEHTEARRAMRRAETVLGVDREDGFWATMNRLAYTARAQQDGCTFEEARRRIISTYAKAHGLSFRAAATRVERPDGAR